MLYNYILKKEHRNVLMGISIIWVTLHHCCSFSEFGYLFKPFAKGYVGVDIFFFLSAYGLCWSYTQSTLKEYYKKRFCRIYPMYFVFLVIWWLSCKSYSIDIGNPLAMIAKTVTPLCCFTDWRSCTDIVEWYIPAILLIYITFPLLYKLFGKIASLNCLSTTLIYIGTLLMCIFFSQFCCRALFLRIPAIFIGVLTFFCYRGGKKLLVILAVSAFLQLIIPDMYALHYSLVIPALLLGFDFIYGEIHTNKYIQRMNKCLSFIGAHTLEIYLSQTITLQYIIHFSKNIGLLNTIFIAIVLTSILACVMHYLHKLFYTIMSKIS